MPATEKPSLYKENTMDPSGVVATGFKIQKLNFKNDFLFDVEAQLISKEKKKY